MIAAVISEEGQVDSHLKKDCCCYLKGAVASRERLRVLQKNLTHPWDCLVPNLGCSKRFQRSLGSMCQKKSLIASPITTKAAVIEKP